MGKEDMKKTLSMLIIGILFAAMVSILLPRLETAAVLMSGSDKIAIDSTMTPDVLDADQSIGVSGFCLHKDVEPWERVDLIPAENPLTTPESAPTSPAGIITIRGRMMYVGEYGFTKSMRNVRVDLMDDDVGPDERVASTWTNYTGYYSFTVNNDDGVGQGGRDPYVKVYSENQVAYCTTWESSLSRYIYQLPKCGNDVADGFTYNYGTRVPPSNNRAWQAIDTCLTERDWIYSNSGYAGPWARANKVAVSWPAGDWPHCHGDSIHLPSEQIENWTHQDVQHEYAHAVMYALYGHFPDGALSGPDPHYLFSESNEGFAMCEGWAEFMECAVDNSASNLHDHYNGHGGNMEYNDWYNAVDTWDMDGAIVEGSVASIFWDIYDEMDVTYDRDYMSWGFDDIFCIIRYNQPNTILNFLGAWGARWPTLATSVGPMVTTYWQYGIDRDFYAPYGGTIVIDANTTYTQSRYVTLALGCSDWGSGVSNMRFANRRVWIDDDVNPHWKYYWGAWQPYGTRASWALSSGDGTKTVYVQFGDRAGHDIVCSDSIILDTIRPTVTGVSVYPTQFPYKMRLYPLPITYIFVSNYTRISFNLSEPCYVTLRIYNNQTGLPVRTLVASVLLSAGVRSYLWYGTYGNGTAVPNGFYKIEISARDRAGNLASPNPTVTYVTVCRKPSS